MSVAPDGWPSMSGWTEIVVRTAIGEEEIAAAEVAELPFLGAQLESGKVVTAVVVADDTPSLRAALSERFGPDVSFRAVPGQDYADLWRESWHPFRVGRLCFVAPGALVALRESDVRLEVEPGGSFGTGRHVTTRGALLGMQRYLQQGDRVLDPGCGSGVLAVGAASLGASEALGFDIDPGSTAAGAELADRNGVGDRCRFLRASFEDLDPAHEGFDGVVANLYYDLIQRYVGDLAARVRPGGYGVFSGCRREQRDRTMEAIHAAGFAIDWEFSRRKWLAFGGRRVERDRVTRRLWPAG